MRDLGIITYAPDADGPIRCQAGVALEIAVEGQANAACWVAFPFLKHFQVGQGEGRNRLGTQLLQRAALR